MTAPLYLDPGQPGLAFVYLQNPTGGVFDGDRLDVRLEAGPDAQVHLTTPSATRLLRMNGGGAEQEIRVRLERDAYVEMMPEPLIPHAGSSFQQVLQVDLATGAALVAGETIAPGRLARGECFSFERLLLSTRVATTGRELVVDRILFEPGSHAPTRRGMLGAFRYFATLLAVAPQRSDMLEHMTNAVFDVPGAVAAGGALPYESGVVVRILATSSTAAERTLHAAWSVARTALIGSAAPRVRK